MDQPVRNLLTAFARAEDGAITVDWIVLTAAAVFLGIAATFFLMAGIPSLADGLSNYMSTYSVHE